MKDINKYLETLIQFSEEKLNNEYDINKLNFDNFGLINSYLIYQSVKDRKVKKNTLIYLPDKETKSEFYIPVIITLALNNFMDNYILSNKLQETTSELYKSFFSYQFKIQDGKLPIEFPFKSIVVTEKIYEEKLKKIKSNLFYLSIKELKKYIHKKNAEQLMDIEYKIYNNTDSLLDDIQYKIGKQDTNYFKNEILKSIVYDIHKAFPFRYITKTGTIKDNLPIAPMLFVVNDYQTARTHILDQNINITNVVFIGANKYKDFLLEISEDLNNKRIENALFIGSVDIENNAIPKLQKWKWTLTELNYFNYFETYETNKVEIKNESFSQLLQEFDDIIRQIENEYGINLNELYKYVRNVLPIVIPNSESRLIKQLDNLLIYFEKEGLDIVETEFYNIDEWDFEDIWEEILNKFKEIINYQKSSFLKYKNIQQFEKIDYLIVPKEYVGIWREEIKTRNIKNIISFKEYLNLKCKQGKKEMPCTNKTIVFIGFYGFNHLKSMIYSANRISVLLYPEELQYFNSSFDRYKKDTYSKIKDADRNLISGISFKTTETDETVSDLIKRLFEKSEEQKITPDYTASADTNLIYELSFEEYNDVLELDENKTILLKANGEERDEIVKNLKVGDIVRVYGNATKDELYKIALDADTDGTFQAIEQCSNLWKNALKEYSKGFETIEKLLKNLRENGLTITTEFTLKNWLKADTNKFPKKKKDLLVLKKVLNNSALSENFGEINKNRRIYESVMKSLGFKFSGEITNYIKSKFKIKGSILKKFTDKQIQEFVNQSAKLRTVKSIKIADNE